MPLAIVRKQARELPVTVELTDAMAMMPEMKLSNFEQVFVGARISKTGAATAQSGDLQGRSDAIDVGAGTTVVVNIDQEVL
jgi:cytochrome c-type biogenesis protein CcmH